MKQDKYTTLLFNLAIGKMSLNEVVYKLNGTFEWKPKKVKRTVKKHVFYGRTGLKQFSGPGKKHSDSESQKRGGIIWEIISSLFLDGQIRLRRQPYPLSP